MRVGVISDTHGLLRPEALERLAGVAHIFHAGDIGRAGIVEHLRGLAVVTAIRGNVDTGDWARGYPERIKRDIAGHCLLMIHDRKDLCPQGPEPAVGIVVSGHSHTPSVERAGGVLFVNPASAGPRRFRLPVTLCLLDVGAGAPAARIIKIV